MIRISDIKVNQVHALIGVDGGHVLVPVMVDEVSADGTVCVTFAHGNTTMVNYRKIGVCPAWLLEQWKKMTA